MTVRRLVQLLEPTYAIAAVLFGVLLPFPCTHIVLAWAVRANAVYTAAAAAVRGALKVRDDIRNAGGVSEFTRRELLNAVVRYIIEEVSRCRNTR